MNYLYATLMAPIAMAIVFTVVTWGVSWAIVKFFEYARGWMP